MTDGEILSANPDASYLFAVAECYPRSGNQQDDRVYAVCVVDVSTSKIIIGQVLTTSDFRVRSFCFCTSFTFRALLHSLQKIVNHWRCQFRPIYLRMGQFGLCFILNGSKKFSLSGTVELVESYLFFLYTYKLLNRIVSKA